MQEIYVTAIFSTLTLLLLRAFQSPVRFYEYPYFMAVTYVIFIGPQIISLIRHPGFASPNAVESVLLMTLLCIIACVIGYPPSHSITLQPRRPSSLNEQKLLRLGVIYLLIAWFFLTLFGRMSSEEIGGTMATGRATIYLFFASVIYIANAILFRHAIRTRSKESWTLFSVSLIPPIQAAIFAGRRENTVHVLIAIGMTLYFERRWVPPRGVTLAAIAFAMLVIPATGTYRSIAAHRDWGRLEQLDLIANFQSFLNRESILELRNGAMTIEAVKQADAYAFGVGYWDEIIWRFVPAQFVGRDLKNFLMIERDCGTLSKTFAGMGYRTAVGSTSTGMGDAYYQFGYFGALFFTALGTLFGALWRRAQQTNAVVCQLLYIGSFTSSMRSITHQTVDFLPGFVYQLIFVGIVAFIATERSQPFTYRTSRKLTS